MTVSRKRSDEIRQFILEHIEASSQTIAQLTAENFGISRQAANRHIKHLVNTGRLIATGSTRNKTYTSKPVIEKILTFQLTEKLEENVIWRKYVHPDIERYASQNVLDICHYGFTEMLNNVLDHSNASSVSIQLIITAIKISMMIVDNGIGIFKKLQTYFHLEDHRHAILELAKGKLTTDPQKHTGEGIFFTSRIFDTVSIMSNDISYIRFQEHDWLIEIMNNLHEGTVIIMNITLKSETKIEEIFERYASEQDDYGFTKTRIPVELAQYGEEKLVSRSQAKRLLVRVDRFKEVILDFEKITMIGQAFADEIFRVFQREHPSIRIIPINANTMIQKMILRAEMNAQEQGNIVMANEA